MKTLFERLKPEVLEKLNLQSQDYPNTIIKIFSDLQENKFICDLKYDNILSLGSHYYSRFNVGYFEIDNLFDNDLE